MEPEGLLLRSQEPSTGPILSQIDPVHTIPSYLSKIHFNIVYPPMSWSSQWSLSFLIFHQYPIFKSMWSFNFTSIFKTVFFLVKPSVSLIKRE
jgi:hypothetical protein